MATRIVRVRGRGRWRRVIKALALAVLLLVAGPIVGLAGRLWWVFELASHFRLQFYVLLGAEAGLIGEIWFSSSPSRSFGWNLPTILISAAGLLLGLYAFSLRPFVFRFPPPVRYGTWVRVLSLNLRRSNHEHERALRFIRDANPDVALFLEVDDDWERALASLADTWPHHHMLARPDTRGIAICSRLPLEEARVEHVADDVPVLVVRVTAGDVPLTIVGAHPYPPISKAMAAMRERQFGDLAGIVEAIQGAKIVVGDLNSSSWSPVFGDFVRRTGLHDSRLGMGVQATWPAMLPRFLRIPLDHCLVSRGVGVVSRKVGPNVGSDHLPVVVNLTITAP